MTLRFLKHSSRIFATCNFCRFGRSEYSERLFGLTEGSRKIPRRPTRTFSTISFTLFPSSLQSLPFELCSSLRTLCVDWCRLRYTRGRFSMRNEFDRSIFISQSCRISFATLPFCPGLLASSQYSYQTMNSIKRHFNQTRVRAVLSRRFLRSTVPFS